MERGAGSTVGRAEGRERGVTNPSLPLGEKMRAPDGASGEKSKHPRVPGMGIVSSVTSVTIAACNAVVASATEPQTPLLSRALGAPRNVPATTRACKPRASRARATAISSAARARLPGVAAAGAGSRGGDGSPREVLATQAARARKTCAYADQHRASPATAHNTAAPPLARLPLVPTFETPAQAAAACASRASTDRNALTSVSPALAVGKPQCSRRRAARAEAAASASRPADWTARRRDSAFAAPTQ